MAGQCHQIQLDFNQFETRPCSELNPGEPVKWPDRVIKFNSTWSSLKLVHVPSSIQVNSLNGWTVPSNLTRLGAVWNSFMFVFIPGWMMTLKIPFHLDWSWIVRMGRIIQNRNKKNKQNWSSNWITKLQLHWNSVCSSLLGVVSLQLVNQRQVTTDGDAMSVSFTWKYPPELGVTAIYFIHFSLVDWNEDGNGEQHRESNGNDQSAPVWNKSLLQTQRNRFTNETVFDQPLPCSTSNCTFDMDVNCTAALEVSATSEHIVHRGATGVKQIVSRLLVSAEIKVRPNSNSQLKKAIT